MEQEVSNAKDHFPVTIVKPETIIGHILHRLLFCLDHFPILLCNFNFATQV